MRLAIILTCRHIAALTASILKAKSVPCRVRSGFAAYFSTEGLPKGKSHDHWLTEYWNAKESRWVLLDVDGVWEDLPFDACDVPKARFDFAAEAWLETRTGKVDERHFWNTGGVDGLLATAWELFYDYHCLMNDEIIYLHAPSIVSWNGFGKLNEKDLKEIDSLAELMRFPDENFAELTEIWRSNKRFRTMVGGVL